MIGRFWRWFAVYRLSPTAVCEMSVGLGLVDYHDYDDSREKQPWHFHVFICERCGKEFSI